MVELENPKFGGGGGGGGEQPFLIRKDSFLAIDFCRGVSSRQEKNGYSLLLIYKGHTLNTASQAWLTCRTE